MDEGPLLNYHFNEMEDWVSIDLYYHKQVVNSSIPSFICKTRPNYRGRNPGQISHHSLNGQFIVSIIVNIWKEPLCLHGTTGKNGGEVNIALTRRSTHLSSILLLFNSHRSPEELMQKVESDVEPRPQATSQKKLFLSSPSSPDLPSKGTGTLA